MSGNPRITAAWRDEDLNGALAKICRASSSLTFYRTVLAEFRQSHGWQPPKRSR